MKEAFSSLQLLAIMMTAIALLSKRAYSSNVAFKRNYSLDRQINETKQI